MTSQDFDRIYARVPPGQKELLATFRASHSYSEITVGDMPWRYIACGQGGKALLFLPGAFLKADMWFRCIQALETSYRIVAPDAYSHQRIFDLDDVCQALVQNLDAEGIEKASVIGLSAGGGVAQLFVQEQSSRVEHLVLSHCGVLERNAEAESQLSKTLRLVRLLPLLITRSIILRRTTGHIPPSSGWIEFHHAYFREASQRIDREMLLGFFEGGQEARTSFSLGADALESWPGKVLILSSKDDELTMRSLPRLRTRYPKATVHLFEQGGHHTFMFFPETYTAVLESFLAEAVSPKAS